MLKGKEVKVKFTTLTPLWTGDAWGESNKIRPSSIMGSLRFWFEVICYFAGITKKENYENGKLNDKLDDKNFKEEVLKNGAHFEGVDKTLTEVGISLPSRVFGCTGWKGWVRIKEINFDSDNFKKDLKGQIINGKNWFWASPYYKGNFEVTFEIEDQILEPIFFPLLAFIEKYGFLGGKWNLGYGRVKVEKLEEKENGSFKEIESWRREEIGFGAFYKELPEKFTNKNFSDIIEAINNFSELLSKDKIKILVSQSTKNAFVEIIKELLKIKAQERRLVSNLSERHDLFGEGGKNAQGTKIIPWIYEDESDRDKNGNPKIKGGFVSIAGIINLGG